MTHPATLGLALATLVLAIVTVVLHVPRTPDLEAKRWFDVILATLLRGEVEAAGGGADAWESRVLDWMPRGRGDRTPLLDPHRLGKEYDPASQLGRELGWDALAAWGGGDARFGEVLARRFPARWLLVRGAASDPVLSALEAQLGDRAIVGSAIEQASLVALARSVSGDPADRLVVAAAGDGAFAALQALEGLPELRDRVLAVVLIGASLGGPETQAWLATRFRHDVLDTEANRPTIYATLRWHDAEAETMRLPVPTGPPAASWIDGLDLGTFPVGTPPDLLARGLQALIAAYVLSRR